jgi:hypothetical protein
VQQAVREGRLAVINVGNDAEISYVRCVHREKIPDSIRAAEDTAEAPE